MANESENSIEFHTEPRHLSDPPPYRAISSMPEWLKQMPRQNDVPGVGEVATIKLCAPFVEALGCGYIMPLRGDVHFRRQGQNLEINNIDHATKGNAAIEQPAVQYRGAPFDGMFVVKFINHWIVKTPPGYSCLFLPLMNVFHSPFQFLSGVIETDTYYRGVHFPALCLMQPGTEFLMPRGTPLVQVVPFRREAWRSQSSVWDSERAAAAAAAANANLHHYKDNNWVKKEFG